MNSNFKIIAGMVGAGMVAAGLIVWLVYFNSPAVTIDTTAPAFGVSDTSSTVTVTPAQPSETLPVVSGTPSTLKVFKVADGPIAGATLIETTRPTSTIARFVMATNGHAFDLLLDSSGSVPKAISNTTIPGIVKVTWGSAGRGALVQYLDQDTLKTAHMALPPVAATGTAAVRIQFLPAAISSLAVSPDGANVVYLLKTSAGSDGYVARIDGGSPAKLFSLPLSQINVSWPSPGTILAETASATGIAGVVYSIDSKSGTGAPLVYALGITATADRTFSRLVYQTSGTTGRRTYSQNIKTGLAIPLSFDPIPELCKWSLATSTTLYCALPLSYVEPNFLDLLHLGAVNIPMSFVSYNLLAGHSTIIAVPGGTDGGEESSIAEFAVSTSDNYLLFIRKGDRSLWGVRL